MLKISRKNSEWVSLVFVCLFILFLTVTLFLLPLAVEHMPLLRSIHRVFEENSDGPVDGNTLFWIFAYAVMVVAHICCDAVLLLLIRVRKGLVFTPKSIGYVRFVSWGCLLLALLCVSVSYVLPTMLLVSLAAVFLGLCLRVVKNVLEEAADIKAENDFTV